MKLIIPFALPGLNEYIEAERSHRQKGAAMKRENQRAVELTIRRQLKGYRFREPVAMHYTWVERDRRRDKDNVAAFGRKVIQDALVGIQALRNDGWANIADFTDTFRVDRNNPRVEIEITEAEG